MRESRETGKRVSSVEKDLRAYLKKHHSFPSYAACSLMFPKNGDIEIIRRCADAFVREGLLCSNNDWYEIVEHDDLSRKAMDVLSSKKHPDSDALLSFFGLSARTGIVVPSPRQFPEFGISSGDLLVLCHPDAARAPLGAKISRGRLSLVSVEDDGVSLSLAGTVRKMAAELA